MSAIDEAAMTIFERIEAQSVNDMPGGIDQKKRRRPKMDLEFGIIV